MSENKVHCRVGCGAGVAGFAEAEASGWTYLFITGSWRCPECTKALHAAAGLPGVVGMTEDRLEPTSIGALKKATAGTILPPSVKPHVYPGVSPEDQEATTGNSRGE